MKKLKNLLLIALLTLPLYVLAEVPQLIGRVNDYAGLLSAEEEKNIEEMLVEIEQKTGAQLVFLSVPSLGGIPLEDFSMEVAETWKIGSSQRDDGLILLVAVHERRIRIEVGYGLEGMLPDGWCGRLIFKALTPAFRRGAYAEGIMEAFMAIGAKISGDPVPQYNSDEVDFKKDVLPYLALAILIILLIAASGGKHMGTGGGRGRNSAGGHYGVWRSGGYGGSGSSGGSFSGGGGSFGGGGASGGW